MPTVRCRSLPVLALGLALLPLAAAPSPSRKPAVTAWNIAGTVREALVYPPAEGSSRPAPLLIAFHGHGGTPESAARSFRFHELWPEAVVVYPRGFPTPGRLTDPEGQKPGWQSRSGEVGDRDLDFFDRMLADILDTRQGDPGRVFAAGHSNGGTFAYLLWAVRGEKLAGTAVSGAVLSDRGVPLLPKPAFHIAGRTDPLVRFVWQETMMEMVRRVNRSGKGVPWGPLCTYYPSESGAPSAAYVHTGGHEYPGEASEFVVRFFREVPAQRR